MTLSAADEDDDDRSFDVDDDDSLDVDDEEDDISLVVCNPATMVWVEVAFSASYETTRTSRRLFEYPRKLAAAKNELNVSLSGFPNRATS